MTLDRRRKEKVTATNAQVVTFVAITWMDRRGRRQSEASMWWCFGEAWPSYRLWVTSKGFPVAHHSVGFDCRGIHAPCIAAWLINRNSLVFFYFPFVSFRLNNSNIIKERDAALSDAMRSGMGSRESCSNLVRLISRLPRTSRAFREFKNWI